MTSEGQMLVCRNHPDVSEGLRYCVRCGTPHCPDCLVEINGLPYCANCKTEQLMDLRSGINRTSLNLASNLKRFGAYLLDALILAIPAWVIMGAFIFPTIFSGKEPDLWMNFIGVPLSLINLIYEGLMLQKKNGQTLAKMALSIRVVRADGGPITAGQAWGRAAMRLVLGCLWIVDYIPAFFTDQKTTLHDMVAGTRVVEA